MFPCHPRKGPLCFSALIFFCSSLFAAEPWFTGPLLAHAGQTVPRNQMSLQPYDYYLVLERELSRRHPLLPPRTKRINNAMELNATLGLTDALDAQISANMNHSVQNGSKINRVGDSTFMLGYQLMEQGALPNQFNLRFTVQETVPTGHYTALGPVANGTDSTGLGSYQTNMGLNFSKVNEVFLGHYLQTTLNLNYLYALPLETNLTKFIGGSNLSLFKINPGNLMSIDFALELSLTQNWVAVFETFCAYRQKAVFFDLFPTKKSSDFAALLDINAINEMTLAPAIEYNFSKNFGIILGDWFTIGGKNGPVFASPVLSFVYLF